MAPPLTPTHLDASGRLHIWCSNPSWADLARGATPTSPQRTNAVLTEPVQELVLRFPSSDRSALTAYEGPTARRWWDRIAGEDLTARTWPVHFGPATGTLSVLCFSIDAEAALRSAQHGIPRRLEAERSAPPLTPRGTPARQVTGLEWAVLDGTVPVLVSGPGHWPEPRLVEGAPLEAWEDAIHACDARRIRGGTKRR